MRRQLLWTIVVPLFLGCLSNAWALELSPEDLIYKRETSSGMPRSITGQQAGEDVGILLYGLEKGYGGRRFVPAEDFTAVKKELLVLSNASARLDVGSFCDAIGDMLWRLPDAHLSVSLRENKCGNSRRLARRVSSVGVNVGKGNFKPWSLSTRRLGDKSVVVLAITKFPFKDDPGWDGYGDALKAVMASSAAIIDLRGNGGGDDSRGYELAQALLGRQPSGGAERTYRRQTPEAFALMMNFVAWIIEERERGRPGRHLSAILEKYKKQYQAAIEGRLPEERIDVNRGTGDLGKRAYRNTIYILADAACASSCESSLEVLRSHPNAKVVGENTGGFIHFGDVGLLRLPHSGIFVRIPTTYHQYPGGKIYDKIGWEPDLRVPAGRDALDWALDEIGAGR